MYERLGQIINGTFIKKVNKTHFMRKFQGFGVSKRALAELQARRVKKIMTIYQREDGKEEIWVADLDKYLNSEKEWVFEENDKQNFLSLNEMMKLK